MRLTPEPFRDFLPYTSPELTFLGVGLVGLYLTLEQLQVPLDPRQAFEASAPGRGETEAE